MDEEYRIAMSAFGLFPTNYEKSMRILDHILKFIEEEEELRVTPPAPVVRQAV